MRTGLLVGSAVSILLGAVGMVLLDGPALARGADDPKASTSDFVRQTQLSMKHLDHRLSDLVRRLLEEPDSPRKLRDQLIQSKFAARSAEAAYLEAKFAREIAEIAVTEYTAGTFPADLQAAEGQIASARIDAEAAQAEAKRLQDAWDTISKMKDLKSASDLAAAIPVSEMHSRARRLAVYSKLALEQAESVKDVLVKYTRDHRTKALRADASKAQSEELARQAAWNLQKAKVEAIERDLERPWPTSEQGKRLLALIDRAVPLEEEAHKRLAALTKATEPDVGLSKEVERLTNNLASILDEAEELRAREELSALSGRLRREIGR